ncbi:MAG: hypothetical protein HY922_07960 [Elusimicrobia bacterium]|nr:hypothetical protein [Elusimicrobiota bacterium]
MRAILFLAVVGPWMALSILGELVILRPAIGGLAMAALLILAYTGWRLWKDPHISVPLRKVSLAMGAFAFLVFCGGGFFALVAADEIDWRDWQSSGAGIKAGMTLEEARAAASLRARPEPDMFSALNMTLVPKGLASLQAGFTEQYGVVLSTGADGRVTRVRPWRN